MNLLDYVDCAFPYLAAFILTLYLGLFFYGLFTRNPFCLVIINLLGFKKNRKY